MEAHDEPASNTPPQKRGKGFWILLIVLGLAGTALVIPQYTKARVTSCNGTCVANLKQIDGAKEQWALELRKTTNDVPTWSDLVGTDKYIKNKPVCETEGVYSLNAVGQAPTCSRGGKHVLP
jgi:hypothetical protein